MIYDFCTARQVQLYQVPDMATTPGSPAMVFGLDAASMRQQIEAIHDRGWLRYETTHNLDQIRLKPGNSAIEFLTEQFCELGIRNAKRGCFGLTHAANHFLYFGFGKFLVMSDPVDIVALVRALPSRPRGRGCIVLTHAYEGQREWAAELARQTGSEHIDLMALFVQDTDISRQIGQFHVPRLFEFLTGRSSAPVLIVSGVEFLKATWSGQPNAVSQFASLINTWDKSPCLPFAVQHDKELEKYDFGRRFSYMFVIDQKETLAL